MPTGVVELPEQNDALWDRLQVDEVEVFAGSQTRLHYLARAVRGHGPVLNIGVGAGYLEEELLRWGTRIHAVDPSSRAVSRLQHKLGLGDEIRVGRAEQLPFDGDFFGAVVVSEVLEHLTDQALDQALAEIHRVLRPGGFIIGTVPAGENLAAQTVACPSCQCQFHRWGHHQRFDCDRMRSMLADWFSVDRVFQRPLICWQSLNWRGRIAAAVKMALYFVGSHGSGENVVFRATKTGAGSAARPHGGGRESRSNRHSI
jgi:SAM-dependent methyltransferase